MSEQVDDRKDFFRAARLEFSSHVAGRAKLLADNVNTDNIRTEIVVRACRDAAEEVAAQSLSGIVDHAIDWECERGSNHDSIYECLVEYLCGWIEPALERLIEAKVEEVLVQLNEFTQQHRDEEAQKFRCRLDAAMAAKQEEENESE